MEDVLIFPPPYSSALIQSLSFMWLMCRKRSGHSEMWRCVCVLVVLVCGGASERGVRGSCAAQSLFCLSVEQYLFFLSRPQSEAVERMRCGEAGRNVKFMQDALLRIRAAVQSGLPCEKSEG